MRMPALSYVHGASPVALLGETIGENLRHTVERFSDTEALVVRHQSYRATYAQLWEQTTRCARGLLARGIRAGDRVGIWAPNRAEWVIIQYATARIGAILVNINPAYKTAELSYVLQQSGTRLLLLARAFRTSDYVGMMGRAAGRRQPHTARRASGRRNLAAVRRPDQYPVHVGNNWLSKGCNAFTSQHFEQWLLYW
jgi:fatty-acyl-CoA synthase